MMYSVHYRICHRHWQGGSNNIRLQLRWLMDFIEFPVVLINIILLRLCGSLMIKSKTLVTNNIVMFVIWLKMLRAQAWGNHAKLYTRGSIWCTHVQSKNVFIRLMLPFSWKWPYCDLLRPSWWYTPLRLLRRWSMSVVQIRFDCSPYKRQVTISISNQRFGFSCLWLRLKVSKK